MYNTGICSNFQFPMPKTTQQRNNAILYTYTQYLCLLLYLDNNKEMQEPSLRLLPALCLLLPSELGTAPAPASKIQNNHITACQWQIRHPASTRTHIRRRHRRVVAASSTRLRLAWYLVLFLLSSSFLLSTQNTNTFCVDLHRLCSVAPLVARLESGVAAVNDVAVAVAGSVVAV
jgi:hypothetical protein